MITQSSIRRVILAALSVAICLPVQAAPPGPKPDYDVPTLSCAGATQTSINLMVCAGGTGAPAGFSIQWLTAAAYAANGWADPALCHASFSGNASGSRYNLAPNACVAVNVGDFLFDNGASSNCVEALLCGTDYVFRTFAHASSSFNRSAFSGNHTCSTLACGDDGNCTFTQGYWKTHGPIPTGNNSNEWPVTSLTLGTVSYSDLELLAIFNQPAAGNGLIALAHQLIAAKLNIAAGADGSDVAGAIVAADALIGGLVVPPVGAGSLAPSATSALTATLMNYNEGLTGPGHCE
jgi:hypothetical protein